MTKIYHNPRCSKSRATLALLNEHGIDAEIILYLDNPPNASTLDGLCKMLGCSLTDIIRKNEAIYKTLGLKEKGLDEKSLLQVVSENPQLLERPIVVKDGKAIVGRPPENVLSLL